jgi:hypothetical protein
MRLLYLIITVLLFVSLAGLEVFTSRLADDAANPAHLRELAPAALPLEVAGR